jgi:hypothetical protein
VDKADASRAFAGGNQRIINRAVVSPAKAAEWFILVNFFFVFQVFLYLGLGFIVGRLIMNLFG